MVERSLSSLKLLLRTLNTANVQNIYLRLYVSNVIMLVSSFALAVGERLYVRGEVSVGFCSRT